MGLDTVELVLAVEKRFSICIPNEVAARLATVGQMHEFVVEQLRHRDTPQVSRDEVYSTITDVICQQLVSCPINS
jgi:hypothetical protein